MISMFVRFVLAATLAGTRVLGEFARASLEQVRALEVVGQSGPRSSGPMERGEAPDEERGQGVVDKGAAAESTASQVDQPGAFIEVAGEGLYQPADERRSKMKARQRRYQQKLAKQRKIQQDFLRKRQLMLQKTKQTQ